MAATAQESVPAALASRSLVRLPIKAHAENDFGGLLALLVTDLEGFTTLVEQLGDVNAREWMHVHNRIVRDAIFAHGGREVAHTGDGIMAAFRSVAAALAAAIDVQRGLHAYTRTNLDAPLRARIGVHAGEPLPEEDRLFGTCVNTAVRVCAAAQAQSVLVSDLARQLAAGRNFRFAASRKVALKGLGQPLQVHELLWDAEAADGRTALPGIRSAVANASQAG
jgi:class 3 adenylate cyclase